MLVQGQSGVNETPPDIWFGPRRHDGWGNPWISNVILIPIGDSLLSSTPSKLSVIVQKLHGVKGITSGQSCGVLRRWTCSLIYAVAGEAATISPVASHLMNFLLLESSTHLCAQTINVLTALCVTV